MSAGVQWPQTEVYWHIFFHLLVHTPLQVKGGGVVQAAQPSTLVSLILSDVIGDPLDIIASGPTGVMLHLK
jgi:Putative glycerate kinase